MRSIARTIHLVAAWLFVAGLVVQVFLAGLGVFSGPASFVTHRDVGQSVFVLMRTSAPAVAALHPVNGFLILLIALLIARESLAARASAVAAQTSGA
jgi:hypothetical protein